MNRTLVLVALMLAACSRPPPAITAARCDRGEASSLAAQRALVEDATRSPSLRAARLKALFEQEPPSADSMTALFGVLTADSSADRPFPLELVEVAREIANRPAVEPRVRARVGELKALAEQTRANPETAARALRLAGRIEDRAGRRFTVEPEHRPDPASVSPMQERHPAAQRSFDEVYDAWLSCRRAEPGAWEAVRRGLQGTAADRGAVALTLGETLKPMLEATAPESAAAKNALR